MSDDQMISTIEVRGKVYPLATMRSDDQHVRHYDRHGNSCVTGHEPMTFIVSATCDGARELYFSTTNPTPCRISIFGSVTYTGRAVAMGHGTNPRQTDLFIDNIVAIPATPTLDEPTAPADIDWSEIRSATEARDWRRAWQAVGTDHTGDATPGETYLLSKAARAKATAAALAAWRKVEMDAGTIFIGADAARVWERIKRIAGWTSQARAQYKPRPKSAKQTLMERMSSFIRPGAIQLPDDILGGRYSTLNVDDFVVDDDVGSFNQALWQSIIDCHGADDFRQEYQGIPPAEPVLTRNNNDVVSVLNNPFLSAAANRGGITGTVTIPPSASRSIATMLATHATNPNPRGPQPRRRSRT